MIEIIWYLAKMMFFLSSFPWPYRVKIFILRMFGAKCGKRVIIKPRVNIHFPWKLKISDDVWIGEEVFILNFEQVTIEDNVCISQRAFLCGGNHDYRDISFKYLNGPIKIESGSWVGAQSFIGPNVILRKGCVVVAGSIVSKEMPADMVCGGNPCKPLKSRWKE